MEESLQDATPVSRYSIWIQARPFLLDVYQVRMRYHYHMEKNEYRLSIPIICIGRHVFGGRRDKTNREGDGLIVCATFHTEGTLNYTDGTDNGSAQTDVIGLSADHYTSQSFTLAKSSFIHLFRLEPPS